MIQFLKLFAIVILLGTTVYCQTTELTVLYLGDTHSNLAPLGPRNSDLSGTQGGIARAASVIGSYELSGQNVLTLHAGDFSIGDLFYNQYFGVPELQILNELGLDAMTAGNHEFDLSPSTLLTALTTAFPTPASAFPILSANADVSLVPGLNNYVKPYTVKEFGGLKVGIFGLTTHSTMLMSNPSPVVISEDFIAIAGQIVNVLRTTELCDFVICLSHYGFLGDQAIAAYVPGIDLIIGGHDHALINPVQVGNTWIVQAEAFYKNIGRITFEIADNSVVVKSSEMISLDENVPEEPGTKAIVDGLIAGIEAVYGPVYTQQIGVSNSFLEEIADKINKPGNHSTTVGNFITDAMRWKTGTDIAIEPGGSIAQPIFKGPIVAADLFRTVGYGFNEDNGLGFRLVTFTISGAELYKAVETVLSFMDDDELFPQFSGLKLKYMPDAPEGERAASILINKQPLNPAANYTVTSNEFIPMMLTAFNIVFSDLVTLTGYSEFQLLTDYVNALGNKITPVRDARVIGIEYSNIQKDAGELENLSAPDEFFLYQNHPNPFNPSTVISFNLPVASNVKLSVFNIIGEEVFVLMDEFKNAGQYQVTWNASDNPAGIYLYVIKTEGFSETKKMILLK